MNVGKTLVTLVLVIFIFAALFTFLPSQFRATGISNQDVLATEILNFNSLIVYSNQGSDETFLGYTSLEDAPDAPQWKIPDQNDYVELWFDAVPLTGNSLELRHVYWLWAWWENPEWFKWYYVDGSPAYEGSVGHFWLPKESLIQAYTSSTNSSSFYAKTTQITVSIVFKFDSIAYLDIGKAFDDGVLFYAISYEWNPENSGFAVLSVIGKLLTFQGFGLGIPGAFGDMIESFVSMLFYVAIIWVAYKIIVGLIPFVSGGSGT